MECFIVVTKNTIGHKVYAETEEEALQKYKNGEEIDSFEMEEDEIDYVITA